MVSSISSTGGLSSSHISRMQEKLVAAVDKNADGSVSKDEFVSNRPKEVSEEKASEMWSRLDTENSGSLTGSEFISAMESQGPPPGPPPGEFGAQSDSGESSLTDELLSSISGSSSNTANNELIQSLLEEIDKYTSSMEQTDSTSKGGGRSLSELFSKIDADGDGTVGKEEFISNRPEQVSEEQANEMWSKLDTSKSGSLTESQFVTAMESQGPPSGPPPGPPPGAAGVETSSGSSSTTSSEQATTYSNDLVKALLAAINEYTLTTAKTDASSSATSTRTGSVSTVA
jgi:Ca2+-binding EF-hand superfamily protein